MAIKFFDRKRIRMFSVFSFFWGGVLFFYLDLNGVEKTSRYPMIEIAAIWLGWPVIILEAVREWRKEKLAVLAPRATSTED